MNVKPKTSRLDFRTSRFGFFDPAMQYIYDDVILVLSLMSYIILSFVYIHMHNTHTYTHTIPFCTFCCFLLFIYIYARFLTY